VFGKGEWRGPGTRYNAFEKWGSLYEQRIEYKHMATRWYSMDSDETARWFHQDDAIRLPFRRRLLGQLDSDVQGNSKTYRQVIVYDVDENVVAQRLLKT